MTESEAPIRPIILFDPWTSQVEVQMKQGRRLLTWFGMIDGNNWQRKYAKNPITYDQLLSSDGVPIVDLLVIPTRFNLYKDPNIHAEFTEEELEVIEEYVVAGGSLLHLTNHTIFVENDQALAARFGVTLTNAMLVVPGATITSDGINQSNPVLAGNGGAVQSICAHDGCLMTIDPDSSYPFLELASFVPEKGSAAQLFAVSMTPGSGRVVFVVNSGWIGDYGTTTPAWGLIPYENNIAFLQSIMGWLLGAEPPMEPVTYRPVKAGESAPA